MVFKISDFDHRFAVNYQFTIMMEFSFKLVKEYPTTCIATRSANSKIDISIRCKALISAIIIFMYPYNYLSQPLSFRMDLPYFPPNLGLCR